MVQWLARPFGTHRQTRSFNFFTRIYVDWRHIKCFFFITLKLYDLFNDKALVSIYIMVLYSAAVQP